jgi:protoheme IX farnesyltransferase
LFAILACWQLPHFYAIAWIYRDEYAKAGFQMLPNVDLDGSRTSQHVVTHTLGLLLISLCPYLFHLAGPVYLTGAVVLGTGFFWCALRFARELSMGRARQLFFASIVYLPLLLALLVGDKVK